MLRKIFIAMAVFLFAAANGHAAPGGASWKVTKGDDHVVEFQFYYMPYFEQISSYSEAGCPENIYIASHDLKVSSDPGKEQRKNSSIGGKALLIDIEKKSAGVVDEEFFLMFDILTEPLSASMASHFPELNYAAKPGGNDYALPIERNGREYVAALTSVSEPYETTTYGIPSIIPFMGRQKWVEKETFIRGTLFLEVFDRDRPSEPLVRIEKDFQDMERLPTILEISSWTQGAKRPTLVFVEKGNPRKGIRAKVWVIRP